MCSWGKSLNSVWSFIWSWEPDFSPWRPCHQRLAWGAHRGHINTRQALHAGYGCVAETPRAALSLSGITRNSTFSFNRCESVGSGRKGIPTQTGALIVYLRLDTGKKGVRASHVLSATRLWENNQAAIGCQREQTFSRRDAWGSFTLETIPWQSFSRSRGTRLQRSHHMNQNPSHPNLNISKQGSILCPQYRTALWGLRMTHSCNSKTLTAFTLMPAVVLEWRACSFAF